MNVYTSDSESCNLGNERWGETPHWLGVEWLTYVSKLANLAGCCHHSFPVFMHPNNSLCCHRKEALMLGKVYMIYSIHPIIPQGRLQTQRNQTPKLDPALEREEAKKVTWCGHRGSCCMIFTRTTSVIGNIVFKFNCKTLILLQSISLQCVSIQMMIFLHRALILLLPSAELPL